MKNFFPGTAKPVIVSYPDDLEILKQDYPLSYRLMVLHRRQEASSLRRLLEHDFPERGELTQRIQSSRNQLSDHWYYKYLLQKWYIDFWRRTFLRKLARVLDLGIKAFVICAALYLLGEIAWAFRPGGAVERVLGGIR